MEPKTDVECLVEFVHVNSDLERLESILDEFNIFTALRIVNNEIRHSNFLSWLLDPSASHGLGDYFLKSFLKKAAYKASRFALDSPTIFEIDACDLSHCEIRREWRNIDILAVDRENKFICAVENKIRSAEHGDQLSRYRLTIDSEFPECRKLLIFLTLEGENPSDATYLTFSYAEIIPLIDNLLATKASIVSGEILTFISHYKELVRRYIMEEAEVQTICRQIYSRHKRAIDLILKYRPESYSAIHDLLVDLIKNDSGLILDDCIRTDIRFIPKSIDFLPREGDGGWTSTKRILLFNIHIDPNAVDLSLYLGPGNPELRKRIYEFAQANTAVFNKAKKKFTPVWSLIFKTDILRQDEIDEENPDELKSLLQERLDLFKKESLSKIEQLLVKLK